MPRADFTALWQAVRACGDLENRWLHAAEANIALASLRGGTSLDTPPEALRGRSILLRVEPQLTAGMALLELDGLARRIVLCTPDLAAEHLPAVMRTAEVDTVVTDRAMPDIDAGRQVVNASGASLQPHAAERQPRERTEWVLLTSGTTGVPKLVAHTLATLTGAMAAGAMAGATTLGGGAVWSTFYDIRRYGGLQIFLRAMLGGGSIVLSSADEPVAAFLDRAGRHGVTHISGTPSHWRRALMSPALHRMAPRYVRLSGEIADQAILDHLRAAFPNADVAHAFASTEAGVAFDVGDGLAGFPASLLQRQDSPVEMRIEDGSLRIRSNRNALGYLGADAPQLAGPDGFVDTGDMIELREGRYYFVGRRGGIVNIGGAKVHPEEIEAVINRHPRVRMSLVRARPNPITGAIVMADVVKAEVAPMPADEGGDDETVKREILDLCRQVLARHKVPAAIRFVAALDVSASGKIARVKR